LVYHAQLFCESATEQGQQKFWQRESGRLEKFISENKLFYDYYKSGSSSKDAGWFVQIAAKPANEFEKFAEPVVSSHGGLVALLLALERYDGYVRGKLQGF
jgi:hypothetical protein